MMSIDPNREAKDGLHQLLNFLRGAEQPRMGWPPSASHPLISCRLIHPILFFIISAGIAHPSMSRSPSPASSLDFVSSNGGSSSESDFGPSRRRQAKKTRQPPQQKKKITLKLNVGGVRAAREAGPSALQELPQDEYDDDEDDAEGLQIDRRADLSRHGLKDDHDLRPLWVDEYGNMYAESHIRRSGLTSVVLWKHSLHLPLEHKTF